MYPNIDKLLTDIDSRYTLVILAAKRARQINDYLNNLRRHELTEVRGPEFSMLSEKPLSIAFNEIMAGKLRYEREHDGIK